jgi:hypothetical protein
MHKIYVVFGSPRSGTTLYAQLLKSSLSNALVLDELNPAKLINYNFQYYQHINARVKLRRRPSNNENSDRFDLNEKDFIASKLDFLSLLNSFLFKDKSVIIKYPRIFEDKDFRDFILKCEEFGVDVVPVKIVRDEIEILNSMRQRNMYFSKNWFFKTFCLLMIRWYNNVDCPNELKLSNFKNCSSVPIPLYYPNRISGLCDLFEKFPIFTKLGLNVALRLRNRFNIKLWS